MKRYRITDDVVADFCASIVRVSLPFGIGFLDGVAGIGIQKGI